MPTNMIRGFRFAEFDAECGELDVDQLQLKWQHYTRALSAASTSTAVAALTAGPTGGVSMIGAMIAGPLMHNARKKRIIIEKHMVSKGATPDTRKKDIYGPAAISGLLGGATAGVGLVGAEALAVDKVTKIVSHVVMDGALTKFEDRHAAREHAKEVAEHEDRQLARTHSMPAVMPTMSLAGKEKMTEVLLKHANTLPGSLGTTANGLLVSASRMRVAKYPLLKEYIASVAAQSKNYMSLSNRPGTSKNLSPGGRNWTEPATRSEVDSDPLPDYTLNRSTTQSSNSTTTQSSNTTTTQSSNDTATQSSSSRGPAPQAFVAEMEGDSFYSHSLVSPLGSSVSEMEGDLDHWAVSPCDTVDTHFELEGNYVFDNLLKSVDEIALSEIEYELERAIQEMDDMTANFEDTVNKRISRTFHSPTDLDTIVRRQSVRYSKRCSIRNSQPYFDDTQITTDHHQQAPVASLRPTRSFNGGLNSIYEEHGRTPWDPEPPSKDIKKGNFEPPSPTGTILPAYAETDPRMAPRGYAETDPGIAPEVYVPNANNYAAVHPGPPRYSLSEKKQSLVTEPTELHPCMRGGGLSNVDSSSSYASSSRMSVSDASAPELVVSYAPSMSSYPEVMSPGSWTPASSQFPEVLESTPPEVIKSAQPTSSKIGKHALSAHNGMKKVGYLGLEPAVKVAVGGSLLLMGVRPSVQRKMLDKAKGKIGMPDKKKKRNEDDDYKDYL